MSLMVTSILGICINQKLLPMGICWGISSFGKYADRWCCCYSLQFWESHFCRLASLSWQQQARNHRWGLHQVSRHDGTTSCGHTSHGCGHLPSTTWRPNHKWIFAWARDFGSSQQGGFANKCDGFKLPSKRACWLPQCEFHRTHGSGEHIPFRVPQHFGSQWHAFTQVVVQDWRTNDVAAQFQPIG